MFGAPSSSGLSSSVFPEGVVVASGLTVQIRTMVYLRRGGVCRSCACAERWLVWWYGWSEPPRVSQPEPRWWRWRKNKAGKESLIPPNYAGGIFYRIVESCWLKGIVSRGSYRVSQKNCPWHIHFKVPVDSLSLVQRIFAICSKIIILFLTKELPCSCYHFLTEAVEGGAP